ncbi:transcriptional regulator GcvA [Ghiorsea bivora]|uniref:transcriptional regulator GcvA n=1 Tax=Ghiorsea bivora TaxID=1485545 RepID=UPI00056DF32A|nr:transcriptional regulator GcvA [Ghiorsea bivora]
MNKPMPSLNALRAFVAVGKHGTLKGAAAELFVTASALSHQIKNMEDILEVRLFQRSKAGLSLTDAGHLIYKDLEQSFSLIQQTLQKLDTSSGSHILNISMLSTFAMRWFIPRLSSFQKQYPDIEVRISTSVHEVAFEKEGIDCAIRSGHGNWKGLHAEYLFTETFTPVCNPKLAKALKTPQDLANHTLLHARLRPDDWQMWLKALNLNIQSEHEQTFETRNFAIQAAVDGLGIAIVDPSLVAEDIKAGRLTTPFSQTLADKSAYYLVYPQKKNSNSHIQHLQAWLVKQSHNA